MIVEECFAIGAPPERVWRFFLDVPRAASCMPGVEEIEVIDPRRYRGRIQVRIGPLKAVFAMDVIIEELVPPTSMRVSARGADRATSSLVDAEATIGIRPVEVAAGLSGDGGRSEIRLAVDLAMRGPLGRFGQVVIRDTVRKLTEQFLGCAERAILGPDANIVEGPGVGGDGTSDVTDARP